MTFGQNGINVPQMSHCDNQISQFLNQYSIPSATVAIAKDGKMVYMRSFGHADLAGQEATQPHHLFRIASISKPITSIAIMKLVENNQLSLSDTVFGLGGILANHPYLSQANVTDNRIFDITVQHLLEHSGGWNRDVACTPSPASPYSWFPNHCDPIGFPLHVSQTLGTTNPVSEEALIRFLMEKGLNFAPGTQYAYSNIGYLTLGLIIEEITSLSYEDYVKNAILSPIGICDMHIGKNLKADKREREGEYEGNGFRAPSLYGTGINVPWEYGGWNLEAMDAHGGWIATARDLVRLLVSVDGFTSKPDILSRTSIQTMTTPSVNQGGYAKGWSVNASNNWWHTGALDGTASIFARTSNGYTWAIILNKRIIGASANSFWGDFDGLPWSCVTQTISFPSHDLLDVPSLNSSNMRFNGMGSTNMKVKWDKGNGNFRLLIAKAGSPVDAFPLDGVDYSGDANFGMGDEIGSGNYVVYQGMGDSVDLSSLDPNQIYHFRIFDYNKNSNTGTHSLYQLCDYTADSASTSTNTSIPILLNQNLHIFPNPTQDVVHVSWTDPVKIDHLTLLNLQGQIVRDMAVQGNEVKLNLADLPAQMYFLSLFNQESSISKIKVVKK